MNRKTLLLALLLALPVVSGLAQRLPALSPAAVVDGAVGQNEYPLAVTLENMTLHAARTADTLYVAVRAQTPGWAAFRAGSLRMDKAWIYIGYAMGAEVGFERTQGAGHRHSDVGAPPTAAYSVKDEGGSRPWSCDSSCRT